MRALFIPAAATGHFFPMVPLAWALRTAGHDVYVAAQPAITDLVVKSGLTSVAVGGSYDLMTGITEADRGFRERFGRTPITFDDVASMAPDAKKWYSEKRRAAYRRAAEAMAGELVDFAQAWRPDVVVTDPTTMVAPLVAEVAGVPLIHHLWGPQEPSLTRFAGYGAGVDRWPPGVRELFERFGAETRADYSAFSFAPGPASLHVGTSSRRHAIRHVPYNGSGAFPPWLGSRSERPRVCVSWTTSATVATGGAEHPISAIAAALARLDVHVTVMVRASDRADLGPAPDGVRIVEDLPLQIVLPTCAVSVNPGGAGSVLAAAVNGVPQVVVPQHPAGVFNAERIAAAGAGVLLQPHALDLDDLTEQVSLMLSDDRRRDAARSLQEENRAQPPLTEAVRLIEELV